MTRDSTAALPRSNGPVDEAFEDVRKSFERFCLAAGIEVLGTMMEDDVEAACGARHARTPQRRGHRWGRTRGYLGFHGGKIAVERPRVRGVDGPEIALPSLGERGERGLARSLGNEPDVDQRLDAQIRPLGSAARG